MKALLVQFKMFFIFVIDLLVAYGALSLMVLFRYGQGSFSLAFADHLAPFSVIIFLFLLVFFIFNLYSFRFNKTTTEFTSSFIKSLMVSFVVSIIIFYIFGGFFQLTPKTNLVVFTAIFATVDFYLRIIIKRLFVKKNIKRKIVIVSKQENELVAELSQNENIGFEIVKKIQAINLDEIFMLNPDVVVLQSIENEEVDKIYSIIKKGIFVYTLNDFYCETLQKIPIDQMGKEEVLEYLSKNRPIFNSAKRALDVALSIVLLVLFSPFFILLPILIRLTSRGPALFKQRRVTLNDSEFTIYKFRSMYLDAEKNGAVWNTDSSRVTPVGKFMRKTYLDEIPQFINILKGDISFVGPRPERPEFVSQLNKTIKYYDLRHSVKAGLTGWAQINYKYGSSVEDAKEKLKYDFYYIKNRTGFFDILILMKTIAKIFSY